MLSTEKAEILHQAPKVITVTLKWQVLPADRYRLDAPVLAPLQKEILKFVCNLGKSNYSFCVLYQSYPFRKYASHFLHTSRSTGEVFRQPHKHIWDEDTEDDKAYIPLDIDPNASVNDQLLSFLQEENITLQGGYQRLLLR